MHPLVRRALLLAALAAGLLSSQRVVALPSSPLSRRDVVFFQAPLTDQVEHLTLAQPTVHASFALQPTGTTPTFDPTTPVFFVVTDLILPEPGGLVVALADPLAATFDFDITLDHSAIYQLSAWTHTAFSPEFLGTPFADLPPGLAVLLADTNFTVVFDDRPPPPTETFVPTTFTFTTDAPPPPTDSPSVSVTPPVETTTFDACPSTVTVTESTFSTLFLDPTDVPSTAAASVETLTLTLLLTSTETVTVTPPACVSCITIV